MEPMAKQSVIIDKNIFPIISPNNNKKQAKNKTKTNENKLNRVWNKTGTTSHISGLWKY